MRLAALALLLVLPAAAGKWNVAYQYDVDEAGLFLRDAVFPTPQRGIAIGVLTEKGRQRAISVVSSNGGKSWEQVRLKEEPTAITCFDGDLCWLATEKGIWRSEEGGRDWKKISNLKGVLTLQFTSTTEGWASGVEKSVWQTTDAGKTWTLLPILKDVKATPANAAFPVMAFRGQLGLIGGNSRPPRKDHSHFPDWMIPEEVAKRKEWPSMMILLETRDAGKTWSQNTNSVFGNLSAIRMHPDGRGALALLEYFHTFQTPSEVISINFRNGRSESIFRDKTTAITDVWSGPDNAVLLAGAEAPGLRTLPIPQRPVFLETTTAAGSTGLLWTRIPVDYRVTARRIRIAAAPDGQLWAVTDTGFILRYDK